MAKTQMPSGTNGNGSGDGSAAGNGTNGAHAISPTATMRKPSRPGELNGKNGNGFVAPELIRSAPKKRGPNGGKREGAGAKPFVPTEDQRQNVRLMAFLGLTNDEMVLLVRYQTKDEEAKGLPGTPISVPTLIKYFSEDIKAGPPAYIRNLGNSLYRKGMGDGHQAAASAMFMMKTRGGGRFRETNTLEVDIKAGVLIPPPNTSPTDWIARAGVSNEVAREPGVGNGVPQ